MSENLIKLCIAQALSSYLLYHNLCINKNYKKNTNLLYHNFCALATTYKINLNFKAKFPILRIIFIAFN